MLGISDADHAEEHPNASTLLITQVACPVENRPAGTPRLFGKMKVRIVPGSFAFRILGVPELEEDYFCNFEFNHEFAPALERGELRPVGFGPNGEIRLLELSRHRFYFATQFLPQSNSSQSAPHPLIIALIRAAADVRK